MKNPKIIQIMPSDESIKELYELKKQFDSEMKLSYKEYYKKNKKPMKAYIG